MKKARKSSHIHAAQMSTAVVGAGLLAGYAYSALAKPVAGVGASIGRTIFPRLMGEFAEKGATMFGDVLAKGVKSGVNSVGRKALSSPRARAFLFSAAMAGGAVAAHAHYQDVQDKERSPGFPNYNTSLRYL